ncbi:MAG TPA: hypothetical protein VKB88_13155 [Bryobacteraceae bacterium]|nr:hypothetical protein [Bryobacteraceae bacterium]
MSFVSVAILLAMHARIQQMAASGQVVECAVPASEWLAPAARIAPGAPPTLGFRMIEGKLRHRFGDLDLVLDDAGH